MRKGKGEGEGGSRKTPAIFTLAGAVVSALVSIAVKATGTGLVIVFLVIAAILFVFSAMLWYQVATDRASSNQVPTRKVDLRPHKLVASLSAQQREYLRLALSGAVNDAANEVGMRADLVRANIFARIPRTDRLAMVKDAFCHMSRPEEYSIEMGIGTGSAGRAFASGDVVRSIWKDGWGQSDIGEDAQLAKVHPELRWILSVPIPRAVDPEPVLVLNVDGLRETPSEGKLAMALSHLPRFGEGIMRVLAL
jgi:hypothetical protein